VVYTVTREEPTLLRCQDAEPHQAAMPDKANPKTNSGWRHNRTSIETEGLNPPILTMPAFINKFATAMQSAVITNGVEPASVTVFASHHSSA